MTSAQLWETSCTTPQGEWAANTIMWSRHFLFEDSGEDSRATGGQWDVVRGLQNLLPRSCGGLWVWQKLKSCVGYQLLTFGDGSSRWLLYTFWTSSITDQIFHWNGVCLLQIPPFLGTVKAQKKGEFWNRADFKYICHEVHEAHTEGWTQVSSCSSKAREPY